MPILSRLRDLTQSIIEKIERIGEVLRPCGSPIPTVRSSESHSIIPDQKSLPIGARVLLPSSHLGRKTSGVTVSLFPRRSTQSRSYVTILHLISAVCSSDFNSNSLGKTGSFEFMSSNHHTNSSGTPLASNKDDTDKGSTLPKKFRKSNSKMNLWLLHLVIKSLKADIVPRLGMKP